MLSVHLFLIRHGEVEAAQHGRFYGGAEVSLSPNGQNQARLAAQFLEPIDLDEIWASPLSRAQYGAEQIRQSAGRKQSIETVRALREVDRGDWYGLTKSELLSERPGHWEAYLADPAGFDGHGGESLTRFSGRLESVWRRIEAMAQSESSASLQLGIVSHLFPTRCLIGRAVGWDLAQWMDLELETGSVSYLRYERGAWELRWAGHEPAQAMFSQAYPQDFPQLRQV